MDVNMLSLPQILKRRERFREKPYNGVVLLFGEFKILNGEGQNIINQFAPKLQEILSYLLINSYAPKREGISSEKLSEMFWSSFDKKEAKNNRGVVISKIRKTLEQIEGINIISSDAGWKVELSENIYYDYSELVELDKRYWSPERTEDGTLFEINMLDILRRGIILKDYNFEWLDEEKGAVADMLLNSATEHLTAGKYKDDHDISLLIADTALVWEPLNEYFLKIKLQTLNRMGRYGEARDMYHLFAREYQRTSGESFNISLSDMINQ